MSHEQADVELFPEKAGLHPRTIITGKGKSNNSKSLLLPPSFPWLSLLDIKSFDKEQPLCQLGLAMLAVSPSRFLGTPSLLTGKIL